MVTCADALLQRSLPHLTCAMAPMTGDALWPHPGVVSTSLVVAPFPRVLDVGSSNDSYALHYRADVSGGGRIAQLRLDVRLCKVIISWYGGKLWAPTERLRCDRKCAALRARVQLWRDRLLCVLCL